MPCSLLKVIFVLVAVFASLVIAEKPLEEKSTKNFTGYLERYVDRTLTEDARMSFGVDLTTWGNHVDYNVGFLGGLKITNGLYLEALLLNLHVLSDETDSCSRISGFSSIVNSVFGTAGILVGIYTGSETLSKFTYGLAALQNPTLEYYVWRHYVPVSVGVGYNTDWFAFSPKREFYFRTHGDLNVNVFCVRISGSYAYSFLDSYDLKKGDRKFYLKVIVGPI